MQYNTRQHYQAQKPHRRRVWAAAAVAVVVVFAGVAFWLTSDNQATISDPSGTPKTAAPTPDKTYVSKYVTFQYKGAYSEKSRSDKTPGVEQVLLRANTTYEKTLAVEIQPTPAGGIGADTGYYYRQTHPDLYKSNQITVAGAPATEWVKNDGSERTVYLTHGTIYAVLSFNIAGSNDVDGLPNEVSAVLSSFQWK